jgi:hypothetical protein
VVFILPNDLFLLLRSFCHLNRSKKGGKGLLLVWHSTLWGIWKAQNDAIFGNKHHSISEVVALIKVHFLAVVIG